MASIVAFQSFRRGTGKSLLTANIGALQAQAGRRVGLIDADFPAPTLHLHCGFEDLSAGRTLNDYLLGRCDIEQTVYDVSALVGDESGGQLFLVPASTDLHEISHMLRKGYDLRLLDEGFQTLIEVLNLDMLIIDMFAGLHEEALMLMALVDVLALVLRHDQQDYQGTAVMVDVAHRLGVPRVVLIANQEPPSFDLEAVRSHVEQSYHCEVAGVLPHDITLLHDSNQMFAVRHPEHPLIQPLREIAAAVAN
jgi:MinD-like ATPase involved in chromosome partitioning or flagellar assembly